MTNAFAIGICAAVLQLAGLNAGAVAGSALNFPGVDGRFAIAAGTEPAPAPAEVHSVSDDAGKGVLLVKLPHTPSPWPWIALAGILVILATIGWTSRRRSLFGPGA